MVPDLIGKQAFFKEFMNIQILQRKRYRIFLRTVWDPFDYPSFPFFFASFTIGSFAQKDGDFPLIHQLSYQKFKLYQSTMLQWMILPLRTWNFINKVSYLIFLPSCPSCMHRQDDVVTRILELGNVGEVCNNPALDHVE